MTKRKRINIRDVVVQLTPEEIEEENRRFNLRLKLGIPFYFDCGNSNKTNKEYTDPYFKITDSQFREINTQYNCFAEYDEDKSIASILISSNKPIPQDLYNRLIQTRIELEQAGLLPVYKEEMVQ